MTISSRDENNDLCIKGPTLIDFPTSLCCYLVAQRVREKRMTYYSAQQTDGLLFFEASPRVLDFSPSLIDRYARANGQARQGMMENYYVI